ncbi:sensor histidine kinase [Consotaella aegiceratis]|uniref:sensor histidine kinase n=1 Tax=Consotaella aegiceratis TaxID=3097961 RepID=UPI002F420E8C
MCLFAQGAHAQALDLGRAGTLSPEDIVFLALYALTIGAVMLAAVWLIRQRATISAENDTLRTALAESQSDAEACTAILAADDQRVILFNGSDSPQSFGRLPPETGSPVETGRFLSFDQWLPKDDVISLAGLIDRLKATAESFHQEIPIDGSVIDVAGKTIGGMAIVRFSAVKGMREELVGLRAENTRVVATVETLQALADDLPMPIWLRDAEDRIVWVNAAYAAAVDAASVADTVDRQVEFFNASDRASITAKRRASNAFRGELTAVVAADRRNFRVVETSGPVGSAGIAVDISEAELVRAELRQIVESHSAMLDRLTTAVVSFDEKTQLSYYNAAFQRLFSLSATELEDTPDHITLLDQLRSRGILPEDRPLRVLKEETLEAYRATEPTEAIWHLVDGRTLRVVSNPQPQGGTTWLFEDLTQMLELESRLNSLVRLQGETLDYLNEAVAVFGQDGRLRLSNPVFAETWGLGEEFLKAKPHIRAIAEQTSVSIVPRQNGGANVGWDDFVRAVTAFDDGPREPETGEAELADGTVKTYSIVPLPNGQTMLTFVDISVARHAERMLREKNEALEQAYKIKNDFVQHVNYELRSPLTNIIGFSALLRSSDIGPLNERQSEYLDYISTSTSTLLTIVNDILDLATIDAGIMELELSEVDIAKTVEHAAEAVRERLRENDIVLDIDIAAAGDTFLADGHRVTQILFNLLSNAANFAPSGSTVALRGWQADKTVCFSVSDEGPGIPPDLIAKVFDRFEADPSGGRQSGAGLGLSVVKSFVDLHKGTVDISAGSGGTTVTCCFPTGEARREAAE